MDGIRHTTISTTWTAAKHLEAWAAVKKNGNIWDIEIRL
jgi:hypothetical protein